MWPHTNINFVPQTQCSDKHVNFLIDVVVRIISDGLEVVCCAFDNFDLDVINLIVKVICSIWLFVSLTSSFIWVMTIFSQHNGIGKFYAGHKKICYFTDDVVDSLRNVSNFYMANY